MGRAILSWVAVAMTVGALSGCSGAAVTSTPASPVSASPSPIASNRVAVPQDAAAFAALERVAPTALKLEGGTVTSTACWTPSEHLFNDPTVASAGTWKVICRVYYTLKGTSRYQDATCIGDFAATPMLDHCYVWEYYSYEARFSDGDRLASAAPTPLP
ncbi:hypothetical protein ACFPJ4_00635 [Lysinimonas soli]|uniref:Uncharacterized protein n=1 Tax=Lysinimonas soli TaxID=1074233 RepID=A0ABW0NNF8_9MICO